MNLYYVYTCSCPDTGVVKYVGMGRGRRGDGLHKRNPEARAWIKELLARGKRHVVTFVATGLSQADAYAEEIKTIAQYGRACDGGPLFNVAVGGPGCRGWHHTEETRGKLRAKLTGVKKSPEHRAKMAVTNRANADALRGKPQSPELIAKRAEALRGRRFSQETRDKMSAAWTPERRAAHAEARRGMVYSGDALENIRHAARNRAPRQRITLTEC